MECGIDNIAVEAGSEIGCGSQMNSTLSKTFKIGKENSMLTSEGYSAANSKQKRPEFHGFSNPIFQQNTGSVSIVLPEGQRKSLDSLSEISSVSATLSVRSSLSDGNISDIDSQSDQEIRKPLLTPDDLSRNKSQQQSKEKTETGKSEKDQEHDQRNDILISFSNIWMNLASPSSFKAVPANYHLYNSLVTTIVPVVTAWVPLVDDLQQAVMTMESNRKRHINTVIACLLAQALPDGRLPGKVSMLFGY